MRANKAHLALALGAVAHCRDSEIDAVIGQHRDPGRRLDLDEIDVHPELLRDGGCDVDFVTLSRRAVGSAEQRISPPPATPDWASGEGADEPVDVRASAFAGRSGR